MFPVIHLGPLTLQARGLILLASFWLAVEAVERGAKRRGLRGDVVDSLAFSAAAAGLIGARIGYVLEHWPAYQNDLGAVAALNFNTLSPLAGVATAVIAAYLYARRKGVANRRLLDALTPGFIVFTGGLACVMLAGCLQLRESGAWNRAVSPCVWYGRNALVLFLGSSLCATLSIHLRVPSGLSGQTARPALSPGGHGKPRGKPAVVSKPGSAKLLRAEPHPVPWIFFVLADEFEITRITKELHRLKAALVHLFGDGEHRPGFHPQGPEAQLSIA